MNNETNSPKEQTMAQRQNPVFVTISGECFAIEFEVKKLLLDRDSYGFWFTLEDKVLGRPEKRVRVVISAQAAMAIPDFESKGEAIAMNALRREFDRGVFSFDTIDPESRQEVLLTSRDIPWQAAQITDAELRAYIIHRAYWIGYKTNREVGQLWVAFALDYELEYLGVDGAAVRRAVWFLGQKGLLESNMPGVGRPTHRLVDEYESIREEVHIGDKVFRKGTEFDSYRTISTILRSASSHLLIVDNYMDDSILDHVAEVQESVLVNLLTTRVSPSFSLALRKFRAQYRHSVEVRTHDKGIHDRIVIVDEKEFFTLGHSIKDAGKQAWVLHRVEDSTARSDLRNLIQQTWDSAVPI